MISLNTRLSHQILNCLGDSITWGDNGYGAGGPSISWTSHLQEYLPFKQVRNYGVKGSRIALTSDRDDSFIERYAAMDDEANNILVFGGVNDFQHNVPLGTPLSTNQRTFYGALNFLILKLVHKYPGQKLIFMTPTQNNFHHPTKHYPTTLQLNSLKLHQSDYVQAMVTTCNYYSLLVIDLYHTSGISPFISENSKYMPDGLHYSEVGYAKLAERIASQLRQFI